MSAKCHVWTAPLLQEESDVWRVGRVQPCIWPVVAARMAAGPDVIRWIRSQSKARALFAETALRKVALQASCRSTY